MTRVRLIDSYHQLPARDPSAATEARILAAARAASAYPARGRGPLALAAFAIFCAGVLTARWFIPENHRNVDTREFGLTEGQARTYLTTFTIYPTRDALTQDHVP